MTGCPSIAFGRCSEHQVKTLLGGVQNTRLYALNSKTSERGIYHQVTHMPGFDALAWRKPGAQTRMRWLVAGFLVSASSTCEARAGSAEELLTTRKHSFQGSSPLCRAVTRAGHWRNAWQMVIFGTCSCRAFLAPVVESAGCSGSFRSRGRLLAAVLQAVAAELVDRKGTYHQKSSAAARSLGISQRGPLTLRRRTTRLAGARARPTSTLLTLAPCARRSSRTTRVARRGRFRPGVPSR